MKLTIHTVDAFTERAFSGNPAGVCLLQEPISDALMQKIATEMNLAETAFLMKASGEESSARYHLRWFTPAVEIDLCGHATLASAHRLFESGQVPVDQTICFDTRSGELRANKIADLVELDFPAIHVKSATYADEVYAALGTKAIYSGKNGMFILFELDSAKTVRDLQPDLRQMLALDAGCFIVTARSDQMKYDFVSRVFVPGVGIDEDPVTGSAHCALATYWTDKRIRPGSTRMQAFQASKRGGELEVEVAGERVYLRGKSVTMLKAELDVSDAL